MMEEQQKVDRAIAKMRSLHDSDLGVLAVVECGDRAIPALRGIVLEREPSGLYQVRCGAVQALAALGAYDVLIEYLETERAIVDPVERIGEDAVVNAAALVLAGMRDSRVFELLIRLAQRPALTGVIGALGAFESIEALPALIGALEEDASRATAETALRKLGGSARAALLHTVNERLPSDERESESSTRRRRSALILLAKMNKPPMAWRDVRHLMLDRDAKVSAIACEIGLAQAAESERPAVIRRFIELLGADDWMLREEIETCLRAHPNGTRETIAEYLSAIPQPQTTVATTIRTDAILRRIVASTSSTPPLA